ncbi:MAG: hypothetical protein ABWZ14_09350 [Acidimicrobiales bacterium]
MTAVVVEKVETPETVLELDTPIPITRRRIDHLLVWSGGAVAVVLLAAGILLTWGSTFARDYVHDELTAQAITFPDAAGLEEEGRTDLVKYADEVVDSGTEAEAYASYIAGHVEGIGQGQTYAELGGPQFAAEAALDEAIANDAPDDEVAALRDEYNGIVAQRDSMFRGEVLRGALLSTFAWYTVGQIAGIAAIAAFVGALVMGVLVLLGALHLRKMSKHATAHATA